MKGLQQRDRDSVGSNKHAAWPQAKSALYVVSSCYSVMSFPEGCILKRWAESRLDNKSVRQRQANGMKKQLELR